MKETALAKHYIDILNIAKESTDARKLLNYRAPHAAKQVRLVTLLLLNRFDQSTPLAPGDKDYSFFYISCCRMLETSPVSPSLC